jgi:hypothetical protein
VPTAPPAYLTHLRPLDRRGAESTAIYLAHADDGKRLATHSESPPNDAAALRALAAKLPNHTLHCALDLAEVGAPLGFEVHDLPPCAAEARAITAYLASAPDHLRVSPSAARELFAAAIDFWRARPWEKLAIFRRFHAKLRRSVAKSLKTKELLLQVHNEADGPRLHVSWYSHSFFRAHVRLSPDPPWVADAVKDGYGERFCPRIAFFEHGMLLVPDDTHALLLAAAMRAVVDRMREGDGRGRASSGSPTCELTVDFTKSIPEDLLEKSHSNIDAATQLIAEALAAEAPLPYYDDYVCVVLDCRDAFVESWMEALDVTVATVTEPPAGFEEVYRTCVRAERFMGRWMRADHMVRMIEHNARPEKLVAALTAALPPFALRVMFFSSYRSEAFFVEYRPRSAKDRRARNREEARAPIADDDDLDEPSDIAGTWRDPLEYVPDVLPAGWSVGERKDDGTVAITAGPISVVLEAALTNRWRSVRVYFREHPQGRPITRDEARSVCAKLVGCGRFTERNLVTEDAERLPLAGARLFVAPVAIERPGTVRVKRTESELAALVERAKGPLSELTARVRDERRTMRDFCVLLDAKGPIVTSEGTLDGVVLSREMIEETFVTPQNDPFQLRARFEEPRPWDECVVFVKHPEGIEEMCFSLEKVEWFAEREA